MADTKLSAFTALTGANLALGDLLLVDDISDTTMGAGGSDKGITVSQFARGLRAVLMNASTARVINGAGASDTYLSGSFIVFPQLPEAGTKYRCRFDVTKTGVGTATPIITVRVGTAGSTSDTSRCAFTFGAGTGVIDTGIFDLEITFRSVGSSTSAVLVGTAMLTHDAAYATGISNAVNARVTVGGGFDSTASAGTLGIGVSYNGGTSAVHTVEQVTAELVP